MSIIQELKRRNVFRVAVAYVVSAWVIIEVSSLILDIYESPDSVSRIIVALLALGLPFALVFAWAFEVTPDGIKRESEVDHSSAESVQTARRLDFLTMGMVVLAVLIFSADRLFPGGIFGGQASGAGGPAESVAAPIVDGNTAGDPTRDALWATRQLLEVHRLRDRGENAAAFKLATEIAPLLAGQVDEADIWAGFSLAVDISTEPTGARLYRQPLDAGRDDWEDLGTTPLQGVRFPEFTTYRIRFELDGYHPVELLQEAVVGAQWRAQPPLSPVIMDPADQFPAEMVRLPGFNHDLVDYDDYFMDRFEVSNRDFAAFVAGGGYASEKLWDQQYLRDGETVPWDEAVAEFVDRTGRPGPATWSGGNYPTGKGDHPVSGVSWYEAVAFARFSGKQLPTRTHHDMAYRYFFENSGNLMPSSNFEGEDTWAGREHRAMSTMGVYDIIGNVREWCWNEVDEGQRCTLGAAWNDLPYSASDLIPKSPWDRDATNGIRLIKAFDSDQKLARLQQPEIAVQIRDFDAEQPASDVEFEVYKRMYDYDRVALNEQTEGSTDFEHWTREHVSFDLPMGGRGEAMLYLPKNATAPYETVLYWPGSDAFSYQSIDEEFLSAFDFLIKSGRAVVQPVLIGTFGRDDPFRSRIDGEQLSDEEWAKSTSVRDRIIYRVKEFSRAIDYLEERPDIRTDKLGYMGLSWGGIQAPLPLVINEDRLTVAVLVVGGLDDESGYLPEVDPFNFVTRVKVPVLMINGEYDIVVPLESSQKPMFKYLGTPNEHKKLYISPSSHMVAPDALIREALNWFDIYLTNGDSAIN